MSGILFFGTRDLPAVQRFYSSLGATVWLEQADCVILNHGNLLLGFCQKKICDRNGIITFFYSTKEEVDHMYDFLREQTEAPPKTNEKYMIYHFFAKDPEDRTIEFQCFLHPLNPHKEGIEVLLNRRSIRYFQDEDVPDDVVNAIFEVCRFSPTSRNSQSYYFVVLKNKEILQYLASLRGEPSAPLKRAPMAVAIVTDPEKSGAYLQDGCIAAYHFMLTSYSYGLGTCWIAAMDRPEVKRMLEIPEKHYVATVTPVGYPAVIPEPPPRRGAGEMVKFKEQ